MTIELLVMRLFQLSATWSDKAEEVKKEWYNDSAAYTECSDDLEELARAMLPRFKCGHCRSEFCIAQLGGWNVHLICKDCQWALEDMKLE